jgi:squalene-hopene/tetraprenyl-beta-curcumene cyclase
MKCVIATALSFAICAGLALAQDGKPAERSGAAQPTPAAKPDVKQMTAKAIAYLRSQQDQKTGGWSVNPNGPSFPAISGLVLSGMLAEPGMTDADPAVAAGVKYILSNVQPDGGIYDQLLPSYNTSICLTALAKVKNPPQVKAVVKNAQDFLRSLQYGESAVVRPGLGESAEPVGKDHAFYGGTGYGRHGRPDLSNTAWVLEGLHASGVPADDPAFQRALVFLQRVQMVEERGGVKINEMPYAKGSKQGGFIYATSVNKDEVGVGQSLSTLGPVEETLDDGTKVSRLRAYGSMTYSGFKSYLYAGLKKDDPRVQAAMEWISRNYSLTENPGAGQDGLYYYYVVFARAMQANGQPRVRVVNADGSSQERRWAEDLVAQLATLQEADGSFRPMKDGARWMEDNKVLITAYALIALEAAQQDLAAHK